ncbi:MAG: segregation/condensation protein A [Desulfuromonas sp.]|mgnify:CR=1 FL=1|nr:MAG: segregation/condensation protein A [Desulfuromonas sp.]
MGYEIRLDNFEGPLDLLLHLIKKNEVDLAEIPLVEITDQYLEILETMQSLNLDVAGEFLVMAATLIHIKSRMLLPPSEDETLEEDEIDPREELVQRLIEYQKYKEAAAELDTYPQLGREVYLRHPPLLEEGSDDDPELEAVGLFELVEALRGLLKEHPEPAFHEVTLERLSVVDRINTILQRLEGSDSLSLSDLFDAAPSRSEVVVSLLALLELTKLRVIRLLQSRRCGEIRLYPREVEEGEPTAFDEESLGYQ